MHKTNENLKYNIVFCGFGFKVIAYSSEIGCWIKMKMLSDIQLLLLCYFNSTRCPVKTTTPLLMAKAVDARVKKEKKKKLGELILEQNKVVNRSIQIRHL